MRDIFPFSFGLPDHALFEIYAVPLRTFHQREPDEQAKRFVYSEGVPDYPFPEQRGQKEYDRRGKHKAS